MALSKEDHGDIKGALGKAMANKISKVTRDGGTKLERNTRRLKAEGKLYKSSGMAPDSPFHNVTHINGRAIPEVSRSHERKVLSSVAKKGYYASPKAKKAIAASESRQDAYAKERE
jgi:hypothetical protein